MNGMTIYIKSGKSVCRLRPMYTGARTSMHCKARKTAKQRNARTEAETTSKKQEGRERDEYRSMHKILGLRYTTHHRPNASSDEYDRLSRACSPPSSWCQCPGCGYGYESRRM